MQRKTATRQSEGKWLTWGCVLAATAQRSLKCGVPRKFTAERAKCQTEKKYALIYA